MKKSELSVMEYVVLSAVLLIVIVGIISFRVDPDWFVNVYVVEDGFIENLTVIALLTATFTALIYRIKYAAEKSALFKVIMGFIIFSTFFVAGEEISWGQRVFNIQSSEFFQENNAQQETNLHNMVVGGKKANKIVFSQMLYTGVGIYLLLFPYFYNRNSAIRRWVNHHGIPVPQWYQSLSCLMLFISILLIPHGKNAEILEVGITYIFMLILLFPQNLEVFRPSAHEAAKQPLQKQW